MQDVLAPDSAEKEKRQDNERGEIETETENEIESEIETESERSTRIRTLGWGEMPSELAIAHNMI